MIERRYSVLNKPLAYAVILISLVFLAASTAMAGGPVDVTVDVSPALKAKTRPEQVVFVFAKAVKGPRAPLAVVKAKVSDLPLEVRLDDSRAVVPFLRISNFNEVVISARISISGGAKKISGDIEGISPAVKTDMAGKPVHLVMDHIVP